MKKSKKIIIICLSIISTLLLISGICFGIYKLAFDPYRGTAKEMEETLHNSETLTIEQALEDLDFVYNKLESRHPMWLEEDKKELVNIIKTQYLIEKQNIKILDENNESITVLNLWQAISRILNRSEERRVGKECYN